MGIWFRSLISWVAWAVLTLTLGPVVGAVAIFSRRASFRVSRSWARLLLRGAGVSVEVRGAENADAARPTVYVSNHHSYTDVISLIAWFPVDILFVYKSTLLALPGVNVAMLGQGHIKVSRRRPAKALRILRHEAVARIRQGESIMIFPTGGRSWDASLGEFKSGAAALAIWAGSPIVPVAVSGSHEVLPRGNWPLRPGKIIISIGKLIPIEGCTLKQRNEITSTAKLRIQELKDAADKIKHGCTESRG